METVTLQLNSYLINQVKFWAEERGLTLDEAVQALISRGFFDYTRDYTRGF